MIGDTIKGWTVAVGATVFVVVDGCVRSARVTALVAKESVVGAVVDLAQKGGHPRELGVTMDNIHDTPDAACRAAFGGRRS